MRVTPSGQAAFYPFENALFEAGSNILLMWDGRDPQGNIVEGSVNIFFEVPVGVKQNAIIVKDVTPHISGTGVAPDIEVKSDPYLVIHSYDEISRIGYRISQDSTVQIKLLPPGVTDINSAQAIQLLAPEVQQALDGGSNPIDHTVEWEGYLSGDTNAILTDAEGTYTFVIEATGVQSNLTSVYRGALQLFQ